MGVFGYDTNGTAGTTSVEGTIVGSEFTTPAGATLIVNKITAYFNPSATQFTTKAAIYTAAGALVANSETPEVTGVSGAAARDFTYTGTRPQLSASTAYILVLWSNSRSGTNVFSYDAGDANQGHTASSTYGTFPSSVTFSHTSPNTTNKYTIYATTEVALAPAAQTDDLNNWSDTHSKVFTPVALTDSSGADSLANWLDDKTVVRGEVMPIAADECSSNLNAWGDDKALFSAHRAQPGDDANNLADSPDYFAAYFADKGDDAKNLADADAPTIGYNYFVEKGDDAAALADGEEYEYDHFLEKSDDSANLSDDATISVGTLEVAELTADGSDDFSLSDDLSSQFAHFVELDSDFSLSDDASQAFSFRVEDGDSLSLDEALDALFTHFLAISGDTGSLADVAALFGAFSATFDENLAEFLADLAGLRLGIEAETPDDAANWDDAELESLSYNVQLADSIFEQADALDYDVVETIDPLDETVADSFSIEDALVEIEQEYQALFSDYGEFLDSIEPEEAQASFVAHDIIDELVLDETLRQVYSFLMVVSNTYTPPPEYPYHRTRPIGSR